MYFETDKPKKIFNKHYASEDRKYSLITIHTSKNLQILHAYVFFDGETEKNIKYILHFR